MMNLQKKWYYQWQWHWQWQFSSTLLLTLLFISGVFISGCASKGDEAGIEQLAAEMNQRIEVISLSDFKKATIKNDAIKITETQRIEKNNSVLPRFNQAKTVACLNAQFQVHDDIPAHLKQGIFASAKRYPAMLRFANASNQDDAEKDIRGLSIKLSNVKGEVLWGQPGYQDFIFNSYPALFVATPEEFLDFIRARQEDSKLSFFLNPFNPHLKSLWIVLNAREKHNSLLDIRYWSTVPFQLGETTAQVVKYSMLPCSDYTTEKVVNPGEHQFRSAMKAHLKKTNACFHFSVQKQIDAQSMPIEDASVIWDEALSPFQTLATITIEDQNFSAPEALSACEQSSFNPWQSLKAHKPLGRMNEVRRVVYDKAARLRHSSFNLE